MISFHKALGKFILLVLILTKCEDPFDHVDPVNITETAILEEWIKCAYDTDGDGIISHQEVESVTTPYINGKSISSIRGIEAFINLERLHIGEISI